MNKQRQKLFLECMVYAYLIQEHTDYCVFIRYSGHVDTCEIEIAESETNWQNKICQTEFYNSFKKYYDKDKNDVLNYLKSRRDVLKEILETNDIPYHEMEEEVQEMRNYYF